MQRQAVPRSVVFDYAVAVCCFWIAAGFFVDAWAHGHVPIETFFTPYHATFYSGMAALVAVMATFAVRNHRAGYAWSDSLPRAYRLAAIGIPFFFVAGLGDMIWHLVLGVEEGVDALLSPTHQLIGLSIFFVSSGPIRSVLADRRHARDYARQFPLVIGLATWLVLVHFGTAYAFDPAAGRTNAPPPIAPFAPTYLTALGIGYYKVSVGVLIVIAQSTIMAGFALWLVSRTRTGPGWIAALFVLGNAPAAAAFTNHTWLLATTVLQSLIAGGLADLAVARWHPRPERPTAFTRFAVLVPAAYIGVYLLTTLATDGVWWDWNVALGAWIWSGVCGYALSLLVRARRAA
jgi:hypothetical protein